MVSRKAQCRQCRELSQLRRDVACRQKSCPNTGGLKIKSTAGLYGSAQVYGRVRSWRDQYSRKRGVVFFCPAQLLRSVRPLAGPIPSELGRLSALKQLYLFNNQLSGESACDLITVPRPILRGVPCTNLADAREWTPPSRRDGSSRKRKASFALSR